ncbi:MAG: MobF family relaxase [Actinomycetota bacterium]
MLSIAKLRVGQEAYQLTGVAKSLDDYYTGVGEAQGQWVGGGASRLGLEHHVNPDDLRAVLAGLRPGTGGLTPNGDGLRAHPRRVPGFDLTFKAPKSASVLYAVSDDPRVQGAVIEAGEAAMRSAIGWLEREAIRVQRGSHNLAYLARLDPAERTQAGPRRLPTSGIVAASFRHRTSRAGDPLLHWHVLVANLVEGSDGRWSSVVHPEIYRHARAAGEVFQAAFRHELTRSLGVEWRPGRHVPEIAGIPQHVLDAFSKRSAEVDAWLAATGTPNTPDGRQSAVLATRRNKPEQEHQRFDAVWKAEAEELGWGPVMSDGLIAACSRRAPVDYDSAWRLETAGFDEHGALELYERTVTPDEWITALLRRALTNERSTFTLADLTRSIASTLDAGATVDTIERLARRLIGSPHVVEVHAADEPQKWTSRELLEVEQRFISTLDRDSNHPVAAATVADILGGRTDLGIDQCNAVELLSAADKAVSVLVGPAGTGKTHTIDAIRAVHEAAGIPIRGAAPSARAALELAASTGMPTSTLHSLLASYQRDPDRPEPGTLLVIDEAGMADIRTLTQIVTTHLDLGGRVLLAGDHHQLPEIGAGGGFAYAARHAHTVAELTVNRRQQSPWEQDALRQLRDGNVASAVRSYVEHDRLTVAAAPADLVTHAIALWADARAAGLNPILLAGTNELVDRLNQAAIDHLIDTGELTAHDPTPYGRTPLRIGERVVLRRNSNQEQSPDGDRATIANGQPGTVVAITADHVAVALDHGPLVKLDEQYLQRGGHLTHAYALTSHRAQGGTWDLAIAVGADALYREAAYVQLSRGIHANHIVLTDPEAAALLTEAQRDTARHDNGITHPDDEPDPAEEHLAHRLARSGAKHLSHTIDPDVTIIEHLASTIPLTELERRAAHAAYAEHIATTTHGHTREHLEQRLDRLVQVATCIAVGHHVSPADRHNVGTVLAIDDPAGTAVVHFTSRDGRQAERTFRWDELRFVEPRDPELRPLSEDARATLARRRMDFQNTIAAWYRALEAFGVQPGDCGRYTAAAQRAVERSASRLSADQPVWLLNHLGQRPRDVAGSRTWDNALNAIARWELTHPNGIGADAGAAHQLRTWLAQTRHWLDTTDRTFESAAIQRTPREIIDRRAQLEQILDTAPADCRHIIDQLQAGQLTLDDASELLTTALDQQYARRQWIVEHWSYVVEYQELETGLAATARSPLVPTLT